MGEFLELFRIDIGSACYNLELKHFKRYYTELTVNSGGLRLVNLGKTLKQTF